MVDGLINLLNALAIDFECDDNIYAKETCDRAAAALRTLQEENEALADALRGLLKAYENAFDWTAELPPETAEAERIANEVLEALTSFKPEQAVTEAWRPIETAPRNESGQSYGPWLLVFHKYDHGVYQARWECHGDMRGWFAKGKPKSFFSNYITHWMPLPAAPTAGGGDAE